MKKHIAAGNDGHEILKVGDCQEVSRAASKLLRKWKKQGKFVDDSWIMRNHKRRIR